MRRPRTNQPRTSHRSSAAAAVLARALITALVAGLHLFPATCANAAGPHSLFVSPTTGAGASASMEGMAMGGAHAHHHHHSASTDQRSSAEPTGETDLLAMALRGHEGGGSTSPPAPAPATSELADDASDGGESGTRLTDLPATMTMLALSAPAALISAATLPPLPGAPVAEPGLAASLTGATTPREVPPPRLAI